MIRKMSAFFIISGLIFTGCASQRGWQPTVDPHGDPHAEAIEYDSRECENLAHQASGGTGSSAAEGAVVGGLIGAAGGAAVGAAFGSPGTGAMVGAAAGGVGGATHQGLGAEGDYKQAYINCMRNRGHNVIN